MGNIIASDLDGTLFYPKEKKLMFPEENKQFLHRFIGAGGRFVAISSRSLAFKKAMVDRLGFDFDFVGCDGCVIEIDGKVVEESFLDPALALPFIDELVRDYKPNMIITTTREHPMICTKSIVGPITKFGYWAYMHVQGVYREPYIRDDKLFRQVIADGEAYKLMILIGVSRSAKKRAEKITPELIARYPQFHFAWLNEFIEVTPKGCSKATGLSKYLDSVQSREDNVLVIGDSGNDVPMFEAYYEQSFCMSHSPASVKAHAKHIVESFSDLEKYLCPLEDSNL